MQSTNTVVAELSRGAQLLRALLDTNGWNQVDFQRESGLSSSFVSNLLSGGRRPGIAVAFLFQERFGIPASSWVGIPKAPVRRKPRIMR